MSILTKEGIQKIFNDDWLLMDDCEGLENCTVIKELARMALAAMDSETVEMPLDYLQGHKDGLEWAARLAEANHPDTGDWLYDDPIELAKAIRKGPDMPPVQPAPVVSADLLHTAASAIEDLLEHTDPNTSYYSGVWADVPGKLRAAMFQAKSLTGNSPVIGIDLASGPDRTVEVHYVAPPGYVMVPKVPSQTHLNSIAMRYRHDFYLLNDAQKDSALATARQMYEECSGQGFYTLPAGPQEVKGE